MKADYIDLLKDLYSYRAYGVPKLVGLEPFVVYDRGLERPDSIDTDIWNNLYHHIDHGYFIRTSGDFVYIVGSRVYIKSSSDNDICIGELFLNMNNEEKKSFLINYNEFMDAVCDIERGSGGYY